MSSAHEQIASLDPERGTGARNSPESPMQPSNDLKEKAPSEAAALDLAKPTLLDNNLAWARKVEHVLGLEARGIHRVQPSEKTAKTTLSFLQIVLLWLSINTAAQNITLASIGQEVFGLGFVDSALCSILGAVLGCVPVAYTATWGPSSGNRTLVCAEYAGLFGSNPYEV